MKDFFEYKEQINKCSKCGLCMSVCPLYELTGNDCANARGKFAMLEGVLNSKIDFDKDVKKYLDMCLKCNACKDFCPSAIDAPEIISSAQEYYFKTHKRNIKDYIAKFIEGALNKSIQNNNQKLEQILDKYQVIKFKETISFTFHKPCRLKDLELFNSFLEKADNIQYIEMKDYDKCCGFSGQFYFNYPQLSNEIIQQKIQNIKDTKCKYVLTMCKGCEFAINHGLKNSQDFKVMPITDFITRFAEL